MRHILAGLSTLWISTAIAAAQPVPFDMGPDGGSTAPLGQPSGVENSRPETLSNPAADQGEGQSNPASRIANPSSSAELGTDDEFRRRYVIPDERLSLSGEVARSQWTIQLTSDEASRSAQFHLGYQNSVVVAPEASRLTVSVNGVQIIDSAVQSPERITDLVVDVPPNALKAGANLIEWKAAQRHRTDCTIQSTYELWSEIAPERTYFALKGKQALQDVSLDAITAVGVNSEGMTQFKIVAPKVLTPAATKPILRLASGLAVQANMPNQSISISSAIEDGAQSGSMTVVVAPAADLAALLENVPAGANSAPVVTFVDDVKTGPTTLVITGPNWQAISNAVETILAPVNRPITTQRSHLATQAWHYPDAPIFFDAGEQTLSQLGFSTEEFSGRRFRTNFVVGVPSDFYANDYGNARLLLDAAYSEEVEPGSHIDVYVNGNIAATVPITDTNGAILRRLPVPVTMRHFRPGANLIEIEAVLITEEDRVCAPGATAREGSRFVLFDTTTFEMPKFARIAQVPNLARTAGTGFPYNRSAKPIPLFVDGTDFDTLSTAATILAKMSLASGRALDIEPVTSLQMIGEQDALFVGGIGGFQPDLLSQFGIAPESRVTWGEGLDQQIGSQSAQQTTATFDRWRDQLSGAGWRGQANRLSEWLDQNFEISPETLRFTPRASDPITPSPDTSFLISQRPAPDGEHIWTLATAPNGQLLKSGAEGLVKAARWQQLSGEITAYNRSADTTTATAISTSKFRVTEPLSFANSRLIIANWLSGNVVFYAIGLFIMCTLLGIATASLLRTLGRKG